MTAIAIIVPEESEVLAAAQEAAAAGLHLICNGRRSAISPVIPPGWFKIAVKLKPQPVPHQEQTQCAA